MLNIDHNSLAAVGRHAVSAYPHECCGVLLGKRDADRSHVTLIAQCRNSHDSPASRYVIDPVELIGIQRDARDLQLEIVGFYHSHPDHPPVYSATDLEEANWGGCSYLIISVANQHVTAARSYRLRFEGDLRQFVEEPLVESAALP
jgi:proteasome lid subunit RPN8/RPN11